MPRARAPQQEKPPQGEAHALQRRVAPLAATRESLRAATDSTQPKKKSYHTKNVDLTFKI